MKRSYKLTVSVITNHDYKVAADCVLKVITGTWMVLNGTSLIVQKLRNPFKKTRIEFVFVLSHLLQPGTPIIYISNLIV